MSMTSAAAPSAALLKVLDGTVDLHCHSGPSPFPRRLDHVEASYDGARINMRAILCKSHHHSTVMDLLAMRGQLVDAPTPMYGGVALNTEVGGINPSAVALALSMGGRCVWWPTVSAGQHRHAHSHGDGFPTLTGDLREQEESIRGEDGELSQATHEVLQQIADADVMMTGGHLDGPSMAALFTAASEHGVRRMMVHHPDYIIEAGETEIEQMLSVGAYVEHELAMYHPDVPAPGWDITRLVDWIKKIGPERTVIDSDLGQETNPLPVDAYLHVVPQLLDHGIKEKDIRRMICENTAYLLGLEEQRP